MSVEATCLSETLVDYATSSLRGDCLSSAKFVGIAFSSFGDETHGRTYAGLQSPRPALPSKYTNTKGCGMMTFRWILGRKIVSIWIAQDVDVGIGLLNILAILPQYWGTC
jgi:hypothetical protein